MTAETPMEKRGEPAREVNTTRRRLLGAGTGLAAGAVSGTLAGLVHGNKILETAEREATPDIVTREAIAKTRRELESLTLRPDSGEAAIEAMEKNLKQAESESDLRVKRANSTAWKATGRWAAAGGALGALASALFSRSADTGHSR